MQSRNGGLAIDNELTVSSRRSKARFVILALVAVGTTINYLDRSVMGVAAPSLSADLGFSAAVMGIVFSAFSWSYTAAQIPGGMFLDRSCVRCLPLLTDSYPAWHPWSVAGWVWASLKRLAFRPTAESCAPGFPSMSELGPTALIRLASTLAWHS